MLRVRVVLDEGK